MEKGVLLAALPVGIGPSECVVVWLEIVDTPVFVIKLVVTAGVSGFVVPGVRDDVEDRGDVGLVVVVPVGEIVTITLINEVIVVI